AAATRLGLVFTAVVAAHTVLVYLVAKPLHARGVCQPLTGAPNRLDHLLQFPGAVVTHHVHLGDGLHATGAVWLLRAGINVVIYFLAGFLLRALWLWAIHPRMGLPKSPGAPPGERSPAASFSRRRFLASGMWIAGGSVAAGFGYAFLIEPRRFVVT